MDAYTLALTLLSARELSEAQLRTRLRRRKIDDEQIESAVSRLKQDRTLNDRRVAVAIARMESAIRHRGRARIVQKIRQAGIPFAVPERTELPGRLDAVLDAVYAAFAEGWTDPGGTDLARRDLTA